MSVVNGQKLKTNMVEKNKGEHYDQKCFSDTESFEEVLVLRKTAFYVFC